MATTDNIKQEEPQATAPQKEEEVAAEQTKSENNENEAAAEKTEASDEATELGKKVELLEKELENSKKEYLFLMAEFDNFRKRTLKEKSEIIKNGAENAMRDLLPVIDDFTQRSTVHR